MQALEDRLLYLEKQEVEQAKQIKLLTDIVTNHQQTLQTMNDLIHLWKGKKQ